MKFERAALQARSFISIRRVGRGHWLRPVCSVGPPRPSTQTLIDPRSQLQDLSPLHSFFSFSLCVCLPVSLHTNRAQKYPAFRRQFLKRNQCQTCYCVHTKTQRDKDANPWRVGVSLITDHDVCSLSGAVYPLFISCTETNNNLLEEMLASLMSVNLGSNVSHFSLISTKIYHFFKLISHCYRRLRDKHQPFVRFSFVFVVL